MNIDNTIKIKLKKKLKNYIKNIAREDELDDLSSPCKT